MDKNKVLLPLVILLAVAVNLTPGAAQAAAPGYKVRMVKSAAEGALEAVQNGESPQQDCAMVSMQGKSIITDFPDDEAAVTVASEALEVCGFEVPVAFFKRKLDAVQAQLEETPDSPHPCNDFVSEWAVYFSVAASTPPGGVDPEDRVKEALSERMHEVCPFSAGMMKF